MRWMSLAIGMWAAVAVAAPPEPTGVIALSGGDTVTLVDPAGTDSERSIEAGTVGFLYPAPGGLLLAPDLLAGRTTVVDLRTGRVRDVMSKVTQPHFGPYRDRYLVVAGDLVFVSWPERSLISRVEADITRPWQVFFSPEGMSVMVFERAPDGNGPSSVTAVDLTSHRVVGQRTWNAGVVRIDVGLELGLMATANVGQRRVEIYDPATLSPITAIPLDQPPSDVVFANGDERLLAAEGTRVERWRLKRRSDGLDIRALDGVDLGAEVVRLVVAPDGRWVAAVTAAPEVVLIDSRKGDVGRRWPLATPVRDVVWSDPGVSGPVLPHWSYDGGGPESSDQAP